LNGTVDLRSGKFCYRHTAWRPVERDNAAMETEPKRKRRWFQFSLRSLLIGVTLLAVLLGYGGWQVRIVSHRKLMLTEIEGAGGVYVSSEYNAAEREEARAWAPVRNRDHWFHERLISLGEDRNKPSMLRTFLGDENVNEITLPIEFSPVLLVKVKELFGEAIIWQSTPIHDSVPAPCRSPPRLPPVYCRVPATTHDGPHAATRPRRRDGPRGAISR
jgi:hypothetical protein